MCLCDEVAGWSDTYATDFSKTWNLWNNAITSDYRQLLPSSVPSAGRLFAYGSLSRNAFAPEASHGPHGIPTNRTPLLR